MEPFLWNISTKHHKYCKQFLPKGMFALGICTYCHLKRSLQKPSKEIWMIYHKASKLLFAAFTLQNLYFWAVSQLCCKFLKSSVSTIKHKKSTGRMLWCIAQNQLNIKKHRKTCFVKLIYRCHFRFCVAVKHEINQIHSVFLCTTVCASCTIKLVLKHTVDKIYFCL